MDDSGWTKTRKGTVRYLRPLHAFAFRDVRRILADLIIDNQLTQEEKFALADMLYPKEPTLEGKKTLAAEPWWKQLRTFLERVLPLPQYAIDFANWLVDLEIAAVTAALKARLGGSNAER